MSTPTGLGAVNTTSARPQHGQLKHKRRLCEKKVLKEKEKKEIKIRYNDGRSRILKGRGLDNCYRQQVQHGRSILGTAIFLFNILCVHYVSLDR